MLFKNFLDKKGTLALSPLVATVNSWAPSPITYVLFIFNRSRVLSTENPRLFSPLAVFNFCSTSINVAEKQQGRQNIRRSLHHHFGDVFVWVRAKPTPSDLGYLGWSESGRTPPVFAARAVCVQALITPHRGCILNWNHTWHNTSKEYVHGISYWSIYEFIVVCDLYAVTVSEYNRMHRQC